MATEYITLTKGQTAIISCSDASRVTEHSWHAFKTLEGKWYAASRVSGTIILLHRFIMDCPAGSVVDHTDGNGLNNARGNLRIATYSQNGGNKGKVLCEGSTSKYKGVQRVSWNGYVATIIVSGKVYKLGRFITQEEAAAAYNSAAIKLYGSFARLNVIS